MSTWSAASIDTANRPDSRISGCVSCFGEIDANTIGSSNDTWDTQCEQ